MTWQRLDYISQPPAVKLISFCEKGYERLFHKGEEGKNTSAATIREIEKWISKQLRARQNSVRSSDLRWTKGEQRLVAAQQHPDDRHLVSTGGGVKPFMQTSETLWRGRHAVCSTAALLLFSSADVLTENCCISKFLVCEWLSVSPPVES